MEQQHSINYFSLYCFVITICLCVSDCAVNQLLTVYTPGVSGLTKKLLVACVHAGSSRDNRDPAGCPIQLYTAATADGEGNN